MIFKKSLYPKQIRKVHEGISKVNVPFKNNEVSDSSRIQAVKPTIDLILNKGGRPILLSHFGRPKKTFDASFSLQKILPTLTNCKYA